MGKIERICQNLGPLYQVGIRDGESVIFRTLENGFEFEVSGLNGQKKYCILYVWKTTPHFELMGIYENILIDDLQDILGYFAFMHRNLQEKI